MASADCAEELGTQWVEIDKNESVRLDLETRAKEAGLMEYEVSHQLEEVEPHYRSRVDSLRL